MTSFLRGLFAALCCLALAACVAPPVLDGAPPAPTAAAQTDPQITPQTASQPPELPKLLQPAPSISATPATAPWVVPPLHAFIDTAPRPLAGRYAKGTWASLPGWRDDDMVELWPLFLRNCQALMRPTSGALAAPARATPRAWQPLCAMAFDPTHAPKADDAAAIRVFLQNQLQPWRVLGRDGAPAANTVTGYYEPLTHGARTRGGVYQWPLYGVPDDLLTVDLGSLYPELAGKRIRGKLDGRRVVPYDDRAAIAANRSNPPPALVWLDDPVDAAFLQIQGSGRVQLADARDANDASGQPTTLRLAYADHNGHPYVSIGRWLADQGELPLAQASMQAIRAWAKRHPQRVPDLLNANPAMVFFRAEAIADPAQGPRGAYGVPLAAQRAIAVDTRFVPLGAPVLLVTTWPASTRPLNRLVFAHDTGTAIQGAARADFYWGFGDQAGEQAGRMKQRGQMWLLWPKAAGAPSAR